MVRVKVCVHSVQLSAREQMVEKMPVCPDICPVGWCTSSDGCTVASQQARVSDCCSFVLLL